MTGDDARLRFAEARVARLATADASGRPHVVPMVFAVEDNTIYSAVDHKPKRTTALRRLANIATNPHVAVLTDAYDDDWERLWWARADGTATVHERRSPQGAHGIRLLQERYAQYAAHPPCGPVIAIDVERWSGWSI